MALGLHLVFLWADSLPQSAELKSPNAKIGLSSGGDPPVLLAECKKVAAWPGKGQAAQKGKGNSLDRLERKSADHRSIDHRAENL
jgi:hypothetical protein